MASKSLELNDLYKLNPIAQLGLALGIIVLILGLAYFVFYSGQLDELKVAETEEVKLKEDFESKAKAAAQLPILKKQLEQINTTFAILLKQLPTDAEVPNLLQELHDAASSNGMRLDKVIPQPIVNDGPIDILPYQISLTGSHAQLSQFARDVGKLSRIITLSEMKLEQDKKDKKDKNAPVTQFVLEAKANTYKAVDVNVIDEDKKQASEPKNKKAASNKDAKAEGAK
ncbi:type 4a pilus biogenesis protein PilO [Vitreoscilla massiliensis]|uniref:Type 4a pilus biogenesis protein PilO n=1 Tax=Vitreoscilla massiliensis TaxID=1689272 RepID=A0ABY4E3R1_9NEIS|nr:type 4a pilus biogenesis protein PilO [Vitreoscilla massiliensis]UOO90397.1 type 4a pilus biogenesis protein PilO [Vitreoscilla massiliensis]